MSAAFRAKRDTRETRGEEKITQGSSALLRLQIFIFSAISFVNIAWHNYHLVCFLNVFKI